jgi:hypothetical protein
MAISTGLAGIAQVVTDESSHPGVIASAGPPIGMAQIIEACLIWQFLSFHLPRKSLDEPIAVRDFS